jgi:hypothetical protein
MIAESVLRHIPDCHDDAIKHQYPQNTFLPTVGDVRQQNLRNFRDATLQLTQ